MGDHVIWAGRPWFSLRRDRPLAPRRHHRRRRNRTSARVSRPISVICSAESTTRGRIGHSDQSNHVPPWGRRLCCVPGDIFHPGATQTHAGAILERRCCLGGIAFVISPPGSTFRGDERNVGEEIERSATSKAAPLRVSPANVAEQRGETDARTTSERSRRYCSVAATAISPVEITTHEGRPRRGPKIWRKRHLGIVA